MKKKLRKGYTQVYTGSGKGKTTAAFGLAIRAWGQGFNVCVVQFMKKGNKYGGYKAITKFPKNIVIKQFGTNRFVGSNPGQQDIRLAKKGLVFTKEALINGQYDLVILDEIICALKWGLLNKGDIVSLLEMKSDNTELILTGRYAPKWLIGAADLVTEMKEVKHYFANKIRARKGIEY